MAVICLERRVCQLCSSGLSQPYLKQCLEMSNTPQSRRNFNNSKLKQLGRNFKDKLNFPLLNTYNAEILQKFMKTHSLDCTRTKTLHYAVLWNLLYGLNRCQAIAGTR